MPRAKSKKSEETKRRIMDTARLLFEQKGFDAVSVREITAAAGVGKGTFYLYFETKFDVFKEHVVDFLRQFQNVVHNDLVADSGDYMQSIGAIIDGIVREMEQDMIYTFFLHRADIIKLLSKTNINEMFEKAFVQPVTAYIKRGIDAGQFRPLDAELYAKILIMICHSLLENAALYKYPDDAEKVRDALHDCILRILLP